VKDLGKIFSLGGKIKDFWQEPDRERMGAQFEGERKKRTIAGGRRKLNPQGV